MSRQMQATQRTNGVQNHRAPPNEMTSKQATTTAATNEAFHSTAAQCGRVRLDAKMYKGGKKTEREDDSSAREWGWVGETDGQEAWWL